MYPSVVFGVLRIPAPLRWRVPVSSAVCPSARRCAHPNGRRPGHGADITVARSDDRAVPARPCRSRGLCPVPAYEELAWTRIAGESAWQVACVAVVAFTSWTVYVPV